MQVEIDAGARLEDIALKTSMEAPCTSFSGASYGQAVRLLSKTWKHGERLRQWNNGGIESQPEGDKARGRMKEGPVLNPVIKHPR